MTARFRAVPPETLGASLGPSALHCVEFAEGAEAVRLATAELGLGCRRERERVRVWGTAEELARLAEHLEHRAPALAESLRRYLRPPQEWSVRGRALPLDRPLVMGIINLTEDSFSGDGLGDDVERAVRRAHALAAAGADLVDLGAESARADRPARDLGEEVRLVEQAVRRLTAEGILVSVDTYKAEVARAALAAGAAIVNDISGLTVGTAAARAAAEARAGYVLNYSVMPPKRRPPEPPRYEDVVAETIRWFEERLPVLWETGLRPEQVVIDPGIAFGKSHDEDVQVIRRLGELRSLGQPILLAHSRKNFIGSLTGQPPEDRDLETHLVTAWAYLQGARIFRVHDVAGTRRALMLAASLAAPPGAFAPGPNTWPWSAGADAPHAAAGSPIGEAPPGQRW